MKFSALVSRLVDPAWGIQAVGFGNGANRAIRQGRTDAQAAALKKQRKEQLAASLRQYEAEQAAAGAQALDLGATGVQNFIAQLSDFGGFVPPLQIEPGQMCADLLIEFARREKWLVNMSSDGVLQFFVPNDSGEAQYSLKLYKSTSPNRNAGNVKGARVSQNIDGLYTRVICVGTAVMPPEFSNPENPNAGRFWGVFDNLGSLTFPRLFTFADGDQYVKGMARRRAEWRWRRGRFDSFMAEYTVAGHSQNGIFWVPDAMVDVTDEVHGLRGKYYISAVRYNRTNDGGTTTTITVREPGQLSA
jgi:prophage tail gpP-like protein